MIIIPGEWRDRRASVARPIPDLGRAQANQWLPVLDGCARLMREVYK